MTGIPPNTKLTPGCKSEVKLKKLLLSEGTLRKSHMRGVLLYKVQRKGFRRPQQGSSSPISQPTVRGKAASMTDQVPLQEEQLQLVSYLWLLTFLGASQTVHSAYKPE